MSTYNMLFVLCYSLIMYVCGDYFMLENYVATYELAKQACFESRGVLASFHSTNDVEELQFLCQQADHINFPGFCYIGFDDNNRDGTYTFVDESPFDDLNLWASNEPHGNAGSTCGLVSDIVLGLYDGTCNAVGDGYSPLPAICEYRECFDITDGSIDCVNLAETDWGCSTNNLYPKCASSCGYCGLNDENPLSFCSELGTYSMTPVQGNMLGGTLVYVTSSCFTDPWKQTMQCRFGNQLVRGIPYDVNTYICLSPPRETIGVNVVTFNVKFGGKYFKDVPDFATFTYMSHDSCSWDVITQDYPVNVGAQARTFKTRGGTTETIRWDPATFTSNIISIYSIAWSHEFEFYAWNFVINVDKTLGSYDVEIPILSNDNIDMYPTMDMIQIKFILYDGQVRRRTLLNMNPSEVWDNMVDSGPINGYISKELLEKANAATVETWDSGFRYCYWNCLMSEQMGVNQARIISNYHQIYTDLTECDVEINTFCSGFGRGAFEGGFDCYAKCTDECLGVPCLGVDDDIIHNFVTLPTDDIPNYETPPLCIEDFGWRCASEPHHVAASQRGDGGGGASGDPHYITFDGKRYDFQGNGKFDCIIAGRFTMQCLLFDIYGNSKTWNKGIAINFGAGRDTFAAVMNGGAFQFWYNDLAIAIPGSRPIGDCIVEHNTALNLVLIDCNGYNGLNIILRGRSRGYIDMTVQASCSLYGKDLADNPKVRGIFGTFDGDISNEFLARDAAVGNHLSIGSSEATIYALFGMSYAAQTDYFPAGVRRLQVTTDDYEPSFGVNTTGIDPAFLDETETLCGSNWACYVDAVTNLDLEIGAETLETENTIDDIRESIIQDATTVVPRCWPVCQNGGNCTGVGICECVYPFDGERCEVRRETLLPTYEPTIHPTKYPTSRPTAITKDPTTVPSATPTEVPTPEPTDDPTSEPTGNPTEHPTAEPTDEPTATDDPTVDPTKTPTTSIPTEAPTDYPTKDPTTSIPTGTPTDVPTYIPTEEPTSESPTKSITTMATTEPTQDPTENPTVICGDNHNSGIGAQVECFSDDDCCSGFICKLRKRKCGRERERTIGNVLSIGSKTEHSTSISASFFNMVLKVKVKWLIYIGIIIIWLFVIFSCIGCNLCNKYPKPKVYNMVVMNKSDQEEDDDQV